MMVDDNKTNLKVVHKTDNDLSSNETNEKHIGDAEFIKTIQKALKEAIDENENVSYF